MVNAFAILLCLAALLAWVNERYVKLPTTVGVTLAGALAAIILVIGGELELLTSARDWAEEVLQTLDLSEFLLNGVLSILLFAGAMGLDARAVLRQRTSILTLAIVSTIISTALMGAIAWLIFRLVGLDLPVAWALLFGALISPTDPVAVLDLLKRARVPKRVQTLIAGESLFNDGIGVVLFIVIAGAAGIGGAGHGGDASVMSALQVFAQEALGGIAFGALLGWLGFMMCRSIETHVVEVIITLAMVVGGYLGAHALGLSAPLAMVLAGLIISAGVDAAFHHETRDHVVSFWETLDQVLNVLLFAFIGFDVLLTATTAPQIIAGLLLIPVALAVRFISVAIPMTVVRARDGYHRGITQLLTWGGLRGGIAISLALGLPTEHRATVLTATYAIVLFTIVVQGLTVMRVVRRAVADEQELAASA